jgi:hypothetical protein
MAVPLPAFWFNTTRDEIFPGHPISIGKRLEMGALVGALNRSAAYDTRTQAAVMSYRRFNSVGPPAQDDGIPGVNVAPWVEIGRGRLRTWTTLNRFRLRIYGSQIQVRVTIGGVTSTAIQAGALAWASSPEFQLTGATIDASGFSDIIVEAQRDSDPGRLIDVGLAERPLPVGSLPDGTETYTSFVALDSGAVVTADDPMDAFLVQAFDDNGFSLRRMRSRGLLHLHARTLPHILGSVHWRLDGPYLIATQPWAEQAEVTITVDADTLGGEVFALSEYEKFDEVLEDRRTAVSGGVTSHTFDVGIRSGVDRQVRIWVAFRSEIGSTDLTIDVGKIESRLSKLYSDVLSLGLQPTPQTRGANAGFCMVGSTDESVLTATGKGVLSYPLPVNYFDWPTYLGRTAGAAGASTMRGQHLVSPHTLTGFVDLSQMTELQDGTGAVVYQPTVDIREMGQIELTGILIEANIPQPTRRKLGAPGVPPSSSLVAQAVERANASANFGTSQLLVRHWGQRAVVSNSGTAAVDSFHEGRYLFVPPGNSIGVDLPIVEDPNLGAASGLVAERLYGRFECMAVPVQPVPYLDQIEIDAWWIVDAVSYNGIALGGIEDIVPVSRVDANAISGVTVSDTVQAATATAGNDLTSPPDTQWENAYGSQFTWPADGHYQKNVWTMSGVFSAPLPAAFPDHVRVVIRVPPGAPSSGHILVVSGLQAWVGPRI